MEDKWQPCSVQDKRFLGDFMFWLDYDIISSPEPSAQGELLPFANVRRASSVLRPQQLL